MEKLFRAKLATLACSLCLVLANVANAADTLADTAIDTDSEQPGLEVSGEIGMSYTASRADSGNEHIRQAYGEINAVASPYDRLSIYTTLEKDQYSKLKFSEGYLAWDALNDESLALIVGKKDLPFGSFDTEMVSYSLPRELGWSSGKTLLETDYQYNDTTAVKSYVFKGTSPKIDGDGKHDVGYGLGAEYATDTMSVGIDYLSNLAEANLFDPNNVARQVPAMALHGQVEFGRVNLIAEHLQATKAFQPDDLDEDISVAAKPSATQLEADIDLNQERILAISHNQTRNAEEIGLSKTVVGATYSQPIYKNLSGAIELSHFKDYDGEQGNALVTELTLDF